MIHLLILNFIYFFHGKISFVDEQNWRDLTLFSRYITNQKRESSAVKRKRGAIYGRNGESVEIYDEDRTGQEEGMTDGKEELTGKW